LSVFCVGAFIFGLPGVLASHWQNIYGVGRGAVGNTLFFVLAALGVLMFLVGRWQERLGSRLMVTLGVIICGLDVVFLAWAPNISALYLWAFMMGAASCFVYLPALTTVQRWFPAKRGLVSGAVNFMFGFSAAVMSPVFGYMFQRMSYSSMLVSLGLGALVIGAAAAQFVERPPDNAIAGIPGAAGRPSTAALPRSMTLAEALQTRGFWCIWIVWSLQGAASIAMVTLSTQFGISRGLDLASAVVILTAFNITNGVSRLVMGWLSDVVGRQRTMSAVFLAAGCSYLVLPHVHGLAWAALLAAIIGCGLGTLFSVSAPLAADCFGLEHFGVIYGLIFTGYGFVAGPLGPSLSGYLLDVTGGSFIVVFSYLGIFCLASGVLINFVVPPMRLAR
jgi:OFA family oxalate/formate antiporter-like MFS transporter